MYAHSRQAMDLEAILNEPAPLLPTTVPQSNTSEGLQSSVNSLYTEMPTNGGPHGRRPSNIPPSLPPTVERAYRLKCIQLRRRISDVDDCNDAYRLRKIRLNRGIMKMRLERAFLLEQLANRMRDNVDESEGSASPPPTPTERPLRTKRGHRKLSIPLSPTLNPTAPPSENQLLPSTNIDSPSQHLQPYTTNNIKMPRFPSKPTSSQNSATNPPGRPPPRPKNAYQFFCDDVREHMQLVNTGDMSLDIQERMAQAWHDLGDEGQKPYFNKCYEQKDVPSGTGNPTTVRPPPRPKNAYMRFCDDARDRLRLANTGGDTSFDIHKAMAQEWHDLGEEGQKPYFESYQELKQVWKEEMIDFRRNGGGSGGMGPGVKLQGSAGDGSSHDGGARERMDVGAEEGGEELGVGEGEGEVENGGADVEMGEGVDEGKGEGGGFTAVNR
ncbi:MAG: hypothetical protein M1835_002612 [Candelina submexicana]|nr:MAG: hypothetical protein M1835_002612 [Candelina submexicana]